MVTGKDGGVLYSHLVDKSHMKKVNIKKGRKVDKIEKEEDSRLS